ncbi:hypothetical protein K2W90_02840 [Candidatus Babeliales bacterium]|nr:hypothetical protein [Candidatus Babeliales bacterium]
MRSKKNLLLLCAFFLAANGFVTRCFPVGSVGIGDDEDPAARPGLNMKKSPLAEEETKAMKKMALPSKEEAGDVLGGMGMPEDDEALQKVRKKVKGEDSGAYNILKQKVFEVLKEQTIAEKLNQKLKKREGMDISTVFGGRVREDYFYYANPTSFRTDLNDEANYFRNKLEAKWYVFQGLRKYQRPASLAKVKISNYSFWKDNGGEAQKFTAEHTYAGRTPYGRNQSADLDGAQMSDTHTHRSLVPLVYLEEAWFDIQFGTFVKSLKDYPISFKMGYFPYWIGRGLSLGAHDDLALTYGGWQGDADQFRYPAMPPGILLRGQLSDDWTWDLYYNKWREVSSSPENLIINVVHKDRLSGPRPERGRNQDRDTWALRFDFNKSLDGKGSLLFEPYFVYTRAPEQALEHEADARAKLGTVGFMVDWKYKGWEFNVEAAGQFGHQHVHDIDRNVIELRRNKATGAVQEVFSHVFFAGMTPLASLPAVLDALPGITLAEGTLLSNNLFAIPAGGAYDPRDENKVPVRFSDPVAIAPDGVDLKSLIDAPQNRNVNRNGQPIVHADGVTPATIGGRGIYNSAFFGNNRFRNAYKLGYDGFLALCDIAYNWDHGQAAIAGGYIGGDSYPYNEEVDKNYGTFIAQRAGYRGLHVQPVYMMERLVLARPVNIENRQFLAKNNYRDYSNLQFVGASFTWNPLKDKHTLSINPNVMAFWEVGDLQRWDTQNFDPFADYNSNIINEVIDATPFSTIPADRNTTKAFFNALPEAQRNQLITFANLLRGSKTAQIEAVRDKQKFKGWLSKEKASKFLGVELNLLVDYYVQKNIRFYLRAYAFFPGKLYTDLLGQPNEFAVRFNENGDDFVFNSQGTSTSLGFYTGFDYRF